MSGIDDYVGKYTKDLADLMEGKVKREIKIEGSVIDTLSNLLARELPINGPGVDNAHVFLAFAIASSLWCGWHTQARSNSGNMDPEYTRKFKEAIDKAYEVGINYAQTRP